VTAQPVAGPTPDHRAVLAHLDSAEFLEGIARGRWRIYAFKWPYLYVAVAAAERPQSVSEVGLRIDLTGYPQDAPTSTPWDLQQDTMLAADRRPRGEFAGHVFRADWSSGIALYAPYDRVAIPGHPAWAQAHANDIWTPERTLTFVLDRIYQLLNDDDYEGCT
jgi:hypothetical protein